MFLTIEEFERGLQNSIADVERGLRRKDYRDGGNHFSKVGPINQAWPVSDPGQQAAATIFSFHQNMRPVLGVITDVYAIASCYRVYVEKGMAPLMCTYMNDSNVGATGAKRITTLQAGTPVVIMLHRHFLNYGLIIGVLPLATTASNKALVETISAASRQRIDGAHATAIKKEESSYITDWRGGRPIDAISGELGWISETGLRVVVDSFMLQCAVGEMCGIFGFYHDQLLRVCGYNLQERTAGYERESFNDQDELMDIEGWAGYPWEQLAMFGRGAPHTQRSDQQWQLDEPHYANLEPQDDWMQAWHRERQFHCYLGQGSKHIVQARPSEASTSDYFAYEGSSTGLVEPQFVGLFDRSVGFDGHSHEASAKGFSRVKRMPIVSPVRKRRPEQPSINGTPAGDDETNYKASGALGGGPDHTITGDLEVQSSDVPELSRVAGLLDFHAYIFNYSGIHPFFWHDKDWTVHQESELDHVSGYGPEIPNYSSLCGQMYLDSAPTESIHIDDRYGNQTFYHNECGYEFAADGSVTLFDGWGSTIVMANGHIILSAAADIWLKSGRDVIQWAGFDAITRAQNSIDLTATKKDIRIATGKNMQLLAGNTGMGGILLESRAKSATYDFEKCGEEVVSSGVILRAPNSQVVSWAKDVYLRTGGGFSAGKVQEGDIVLDASKGARDITTHASRMTHFMRNSLRLIYNLGPVTLGGHEFALNQSVLGGQLCVGGAVEVVGQVLARDSFVSERGHIITAQAAGGAEHVASLEGVQLGRAAARLRTCENKGKEGTVTAGASGPSASSGTALYQSSLQTPFYDSQKAGNDNTIEKAEVSLRSAMEYKTTDFKVYEDRWQQQDRVGPNGAKFWVEKAVTCHGDETYPYPGKEAYESSALYEQDLTIFEITGTQGKSKDRGEDGDLEDTYAAPKYGMPTPTSLKDKYRVVCQVT